MTPQEISQVYQTLAGLEIQLEHRPERGQEYLTLKLIECREKQNIVTELIVKTNQAYSAVLQARRGQEKALKHAGTSEQGMRLREELAPMLDEYEGLRLLLDALSVRKGNLVRTSSDIRTLSNIITGTLAAGGNGGRPQAPVSPVAPGPDWRLGPQSDQTSVDRQREAFVKAVFAGAVVEQARSDAEPPVVAKEPQDHAPVPAPPVMVVQTDDEDIAAFLES